MEQLEVQTGMEQDRLGPPESAVSPSANRISEPVGTLAGHLSAALKGTPLQESFFSGSKPDDVLNAAIAACGSTDVSPVGAVLATREAVKGLPTILGRLVLYAVTVKGLLKPLLRAQRRGFAVLPFVNGRTVGPLRTLRFGDVRVVVVHAAGRRIAARYYAVTRHLGNQSMVVVGGPGGCLMAKDLTIPLGLMARTNRGGSSAFEQAVSLRGALDGEEFHPTMQACLGLIAEVQVRDGNASIGTTAQDYGVPPVALIDGTFRWNKLPDQQLARDLKAQVDRRFAEIGEAEDYFIERQNRSNFLPAVDFRVGPDGLLSVGEIADGPGIRSCITPGEGEAGEWTYLPLVATARFKLLGPAMRLRNQHVSVDLTTVPGFKGAENVAPLEEDISC